MAEANEATDDMTPEDRLTWLREHGVIVETPEERRAKEVSKIMKDPVEDGGVTDRITFLLIHHDTSHPVKELTLDIPVNSTSDLGLIEKLKPVFAAMSSGKTVDLDLLTHQPSQTLGSANAPPEVSQETLQQVAKDTHVEKFPLVNPTESNKYTGITIYLDEIGMLKRLPLNSRATDYAARAGYDPAPQFYGSVVMGRSTIRPYFKPLNMTVGQDSSPTAAPWLQRATMDNLEYQTNLNSLTGRSGDERQAAVAGTEGVAQERDGYSWTQTEQELELVVALPADTPEISSKHIKVKYLPQSIQVMFQNKSLLSINLFERVDPDGCTWTLDRSKDKAVKLNITMEKLEEALWPRIQD